ncbi:MAG: cytochrome P450 [Actinomycetota bacterium]|nr:cytochrome P450 [Actinomycetota bacterium]
MTDPDYDPYSVEAMADPLPIYARLRAWPGPYRLERYGAWALARFADVWEVFSDMEDFSIADGPIFERALLDGSRPVPGDEERGPLTGFVSLDPPLHTELRSAVSTGLRPRAVAALEDRVRDLARQRLDALVPAGRFDVREDYAGPVSAAVICLLVGLPLDHVAAVQNLANAALRRSGGRPGLGADAISARDDLDRLLLDRVRVAPGDGLAGPLSQMDIGGRPLTDTEIVTQIRGVVSGGVETVPKVVAAGLLELWRDPQARRALTATPGGCAGAFEEMVRLGGPLQWVGRTLLRDRVVAGQEMRAGDRVLLLIASANRDGAEFADPDRFVWDRRIERHVGFGYGRHHCIGTHVARLEGRVLLEELLARVPDYSIQLDGIEMPPSEFQVGYTRMPLIVG